MQSTISRTWRLSSNRALPSLLSDSLSCYQSSGLRTNKRSWASTFLRARTQRSLRPPFQAAYHLSNNRMFSETAAEPVDAGGDDNGASEVTESEPEVQYAFTPPPPLSDAAEQKVQNVFDKILSLDMVEVHLLTQLIHEKMGVNPDEVGSVSAAGASTASAGEDDAVAEEKKLKELKLVGFDAKLKIKVIKEVRSIGGLGLKEAKDLVEGAPKILQKDLSPERAEELKAQLEAVGAQVEIV